MADPFQNVDAAGSDFVDLIVTGLENRAAEDQMILVIEAYLDDINWPEDGLHVEVGAGTGAITRRMAARACNGKAIGIDPSPSLIGKALELAHGQRNLHFEVGDGAELRFEDNSVDSVVMHTVLSHVPEPSTLLSEAMRVLKPGGFIVVCDADFEKTTLGNYRGDPLNACAECFVENFVTQPYLTAQIRGLAEATGFEVQHFRVVSRVITNNDGGLLWVAMSGNLMVERGLLGRALADAMVDEYKHRRDTGSLYGSLPFSTTIGRKPS